MLDLVCSFWAACCNGISVTAFKLYIIVMGDGELVEWLQDGEDDWDSDAVLDEWDSVQTAEGYARCVQVGAKWVRIANSECAQSTKAPKAVTGMQRC